MRSFEDMQQKDLSNAKFFLLCLFLEWVRVGYNEAVLSMVNLVKGRFSFFFSLFFNVKFIFF